MLLLRRWKIKYRLLYLSLKMCFFILPSCTVYLTLSQYKICNVSLLIEVCHDKTMRRWSCSLCRSCFQTGETAEKGVTSQKMGRRVAWVERVFTPQTRWDKTTAIRGVTDASSLWRYRRRHTWKNNIPACQWAGPDVGGGLNLLQTGKLGVNPVAGLVRSKPRSGRWVASFFPPNCA